MDLEKRVDDHDIRIMVLEKNDIKQQMKLQEIQTSQVEIKNLLLEQDKNNNKMMQDLVKNLTESITDTVKSNNNDNTYTKKQIWIFIGIILTIFGSVIAIIDKLLIH